MSIADKKEIQDLYKKEAGSLINKIEKGLSRLNNKLPTTNYKQQLFQLLRYAHTLKGISGTCGCYKIEEAAKPILELFRAAKDGKLEISLKDKALVKEKLKVCEKLLKKK